MCARRMPSLSAASRLGLRSAIFLCPRLRRSYQSAKGELVAVRTKSGDDGDRRIGESGLSPLRLTRVDVGKVDLDERNGGAGERITDGETRVRVCARVHERAVDFPAQ